MLAKSDIPTLLIYDDQCWLCKNLAKLVEQNISAPLDLDSWSSFRLSAIAERFLEKTERQSEKPQQLLVINDGKLLRAQDAWLWLLQNHPQLKTLSWLAKKLHLENTLAETLEHTGKFFARRCAWCRPW